MKNDEFLVLLAIGSISPSFWGKLHEMIRVLNVVACPIIFILFDDPDW